MLEYQDHSKSKETFHVATEDGSCLQNMQDSLLKGGNYKSSKFFFSIFFVVLLFLGKSLEEEKSSSSPPPAEQHLLTSKPKEKQEAAAVEAPKDAKRESRRCETAISSDCGSMQINIFILYLTC